MLSTYFTLPNNTDPMIHSIQQLRCDCYKQIWSALGIWQWITLLILHYVSSRLVTLTPLYKPFLAPNVSFKLTSFPFNSCPECLLNFLRSEHMKLVTLMKIFMTFTSCHVTDSHTCYITSRQLSTRKTETGAVFRN